MKRLFFLFCLFASPAYGANAPIFSQTSLSGPILVWNGAAFITLLSKLNALQAPAVTPVNGNCASWNNGIPVDAGGPCTVGGGGGTVVGGASNQLAYYPGAGPTVSGLNVGSGLTIGSGALSLAPPTVIETTPVQGDGSTTAFTFNSSISPALISVSVGGVPQSSTANYTATSTVLTFAAAPPLGAQILVIYGGLTANLPALAPSAYVDTTNASNIAFTQSGTGAVAVPLALKLRQGVVDLIDFDANGTGCDGVHDMQPALVKSETYLNSFYNGGQIRLPAGTCVLGSTYAMTHQNIHLVGVGVGATVLAPNFATGDVVSLGINGGEEAANEISSLTITPSITRTSGANVAIWSKYSLAKDIVFTSCYNCVTSDSDGNTTAVHMQNLMMLQCTGSGILLGASSGAGQFANEIFLNNISTGSCATALDIVYADGVYGDALSFYQSINAVKMHPGTSQAVSHILMTRLIADSSSSSGVVLLNSGGNIGDISCNQCAMNSNNGDGFAISTGANVKGIKITDSYAENNQRQGYDIYSGTNIDLENDYACYNSRVGSGQAAGAYFAPGVSGFTIVGGRYGACGYLFYGQGATALTNYGIVIDTGAGDNFKITGVDLSGNATGALLDLATGTHAVVSNNASYNPIGVSTLTVGASPYTVPKKHYDQNLNIFGGTVSGVTLNGTTVCSSSPCAVQAHANDAVVVTYSAAPTVVANGS